MHFGATDDEVAEIIANDSPLIEILLADWSSKFRSQGALVHSALTEWARSYLQPKLYEEKKMADLHGGPALHDGKYPKHAAQCFCFMPFTEFPLGYDYGYLKKGYSAQYGSGLVAAMKRDFGITIKYPRLPLFGAAIWPYEIEFWPIEMIHVSVAVPLMLNLM